MKLVIEKNIGLITSLLDMGSKLSPETKVNIGSTGFSTIITSGGNAGMELSIPKEAFDVYEGEGIYGINLKDLVTSMKKMKAPITIEENENLIVVSGGKDKLSLPIIDEITGFDNLPEVSPKTEATTTFQDFTIAIKKLKDVGGEAFKFYIKDCKFKGKSKNGLKNLETEISDAPAGDDEIFIAVDYIDPILISNNDTIKILFEKDKVFVIKYEKEGAKMTYMIATRVDEF